MSWRFALSPVIVLLFVSTPASAMWLRLSDQELIKTSAAIVNARLVSEEERRVGQAVSVIRLGRLRVKHQYKGDGQEYFLILLPDKNAPITSIDTLYRVGQQGIWFLRPHPSLSEIYLADGPGRFWPLEKEAKLQSLMSSLTKVRDD